nr:tetratricopeptide repeat protein [Bacteroides fragilis]
MIVQYETLKANNQSPYMDGDQLADIADQYASERRFKEAQEVISYGLGLHPGHTDLMVEQAYLFLDLNQPRKAREVADLITDTYSANVKLLLAELLLNEGKLDDADQILDSIEEEEKNELGILVDVVYLYTDLGYPEKGIQWLTRGIELYKDDEDFLAATADCYGAAGAAHIEKAAFFYNKLIDKNPYNPAYWVGLAKCQFATKDFDKAVESCDFAIAADEEFGEAHIIKAHSLFHLENIEGAIAEYQKALEYKTLSPEFTYMFIGLAYAHQENWAEAAESYRLALQAIEESGNGSSPLLSDIYSNKAVCASHLGDSAEAHRLCRLAKELAPQDAEPYLLEGRIYMEEGNFDQARAEWALALRYAPEADTWMEIGNYSLEYRMLENARFCFEQVLEEDPEYPKVCEQLASVCLVLQDHEGFKKYNEMCGNSINLESLRNMILEMGTDGEQMLRELDDFLKDEK